MYFFKCLVFAEQFRLKRHGLKCAVINEDYRSYKRHFVLPMAFKYKLLVRQNPSFLLTSLAISLGKMSSPLAADTFMKLSSGRLLYSSGQEWALDSHSGIKHGPWAWGYIIASAISRLTEL